MGLETGEGSSRQAIVMLGMVTGSQTQQGRQNSPPLGSPLPINHCSSHQRLLFSWLSGWWRLNLMGLVSLWGRYGIIIPTSTGAGHGHKASQDGWMQGHRGEGHADKAAGKALRLLQQ